MAIERVLLTGAAGRIGSVLRDGLRGRYPTLRLFDVADISAAAEGEEAVSGDLRDYATVEAATAGVDAVVHLGALPGEAAFADICDHNIIGTYHVFEAARRSGVERVVFASSNHATGFYPTDRRIGPDDPVRPDTYYGVSKVFGEALARLYHDKFGLQVACLRIGSFKPRPRNRRELSSWLSHRDGVQLIRRCLDAPRLGFAILYGASATTRSWWVNPDADRLGYRPQDSADDYAEDILDGDAAAGGDATQVQGGPFADPEVTAEHPPGVPRRGTAAR